MTRLLKTPIIGPSAKTVASSWIDIEAGLSAVYIRRMPPDFCAKDGIDSNVQTIAVTTAIRSSAGLIGSLPVQCRMGLLSASPDGGFCSAQPILPSQDL